MNPNPLTQVNNIANPNQTAPRTPPDALRLAAQQFEAILLTQLTSALSSAGGEDEDSLFGSDGGSGLAKQMFSEQLATTMAQSGGIGLSDLILRQFGIKQSNATLGKDEALTKPTAAVKDIRENTSAPVNESNNAPLINKSNNPIVPVTQNATLGNPDEAVLVSSFEEEIKTDGIDDSLKNLVMDGKIVNSTRPRIVPNQPITQIVAPPPVAPVTVQPVAEALAPKTVTYQMPVIGRISSGFGNRFHPIDKKIKFHAGIDIAVPLGTPVGAAAGGKVIFAGWQGGYGNVVIIQHPDGRESRYGHLSKILVKVGDEVTAGQEIALSGSTGKSTGPHLHFEIRENGEVVNPLKIMSNVLPKASDR